MNDHEPFAQTWLGIALQLLTGAWLIGMGVYLWLQR
jgi:hypothetical protein